MEVDYHQIARMIDHSLLSPATTVDELEVGIDLAVAYEVASVCIMPFYVQRTAEKLAGTGVKVSTTIGFPHGGHATSVKQAEAERALADGCEELDLVINISQALSGNWKAVARDIEAVLEPAHAAGQKVKVIFENCYLNDAQKIRLCEMCSELRADWVKTSTGFGTSGATREDVQLMRAHAADAVQVKAAGGVRDLESVLAFRRLGASRVGASRTPEILDSLRRSAGLPAIASGSPSRGSY